MITRIHDLQSGPETYPPFNYQRVSLTAIFFGIDFMTYLISYIYVLNKANKYTRFRKLGKKPLSIITFPILYFFFGFLICVGFLLFDFLQEQETNDKVNISWLVVVLEIINAMLINFFMLRILLVAYLLRCSTKEQEAWTENCYHCICAVYLPLYFVLDVFLVITGKMSLKSDLKDSAKTQLVSAIIILNVLKEFLTATLGISVLIFSHRIKNIADEVRYYWGNSTPTIGKLKILRCYLITIALTYLLCDVLYSVLQPIIQILNVKSSGSGEDDQTLPLNFEVLGLIKVELILILNLQILSFYHKTSFNIDSFL